MLTSLGLFALDLGDQGSTLPMRFARLKKGFWWPDSVHTEFSRWNPGEIGSALFWRGVVFKLQALQCSSAARVGTALDQRKKCESDSPPSTCCC